MIGQIKQVRLCNKEEALKVQLSSDYRELLS